MAVKDLLRLKKNIEEDEVGITIERIDSIMRKHSYYACAELKYSAFLGLFAFSESEGVGQDILAYCLEGAPGTGKTAFAKIYQKVIEEIYGEKVTFIDYQCDPTTGKEELYEDINIKAAIKNDAENVIIPGKVTEAIIEVNKGKKVLLFLDEYDKAREETDSFLLQFLQDGKINSNQNGDMEIKPEFKHNLQVILCKNDHRENLSGPLTRRLKIVRLDYMLPEVFYLVSKERLIDKRKDDKKVHKSILDYVAAIYKISYDLNKNNKDLLNRLPSCAEMLVATNDADTLKKYDKQVSKEVIDHVILTTMFKDQDDFAAIFSELNKNEKFNKNNKEKSKSDSKPSTGATEEWA